MPLLTLRSMTAALLTGVAVAAATVTPTTPVASTTGTADTAAFIAMRTAAAAPQAAARASACRAATAGTTTRVAPGSGKTVALTFDDSSATDMTAILAILRRHGVRATFFNIGSEDAKMPGVVSAAAADGHLVEPHTWNHQYPSRSNGNWSVPYLSREISTTAAQQQALTGRRPCFFRPPGGHLTHVSAVARAQGLQTVLWSVDSRDWSEQRHLSAAATAGIVRRATDLRYSNKNHPVVLMHAGKMSPEPGGHLFSDRPNTVAALPQIIAWYRSHGFRFVAMDGSSGLRPAATGHGLGPDSRPDLVTVSGRGALDLHSGGPGARLGVPVRIAAAGWQAFDQIVATDWTGDRRPDLLARTPGGQLRLYTGNGAGGFVGAGRQIGTGWNVYDTILAPGDVSGDGKADLVGRTRTGRLELRRGNGLGAFTGGPVALAGSAGGYDRLVATGDVTGDGRADLVGRTPDGTLWALPGTGRGGFGTPRRIAAGWNTYTTIIGVGDLTGDGRPDIGAITRTGTLSMFARTGAVGSTFRVVSSATGWTQRVVVGVR